MKRIERWLANMRANPAGVPFSDAVKVAEYYFGEPRTRGGSHIVFKMPWPGDPRVNLQRGPNGKAKAYQVRQLLQAIDLLGAKAREETDDD